MHQMPMIRNYLLHPHKVGPFRVLPLGANDKTVAIFYGDFGGWRFEEIDVPLIVAGLHMPPRFAEIQDGEHGACGDSHGDSGATCVWRAGRLPALELSFPNAGADNRDNANSQQSCEHQEKPPQRLLHRQRPLRESGHRHREFPFALRAVRKDTDLQSAKLHEPEAGGKELGVLFRGLCEIGSGWKLCALTGQPQRNDSNALDFRRFAADFDFCDAGNYLRRAHGDKKMVGAGSAFTKNVGAPDVARQRDFERKKDKHNQRETVAHSVSSESIGTKQITWRALRLKKIALSSKNVSSPNAAHPVSPLRPEARHQNGHKQRYRHTSCELSGRVLRANVDVSNPF